MFRRTIFLLLLLSTALFGEVTVQTKYAFDKSEEYFIDNIYDQKEKFVYVDDNSFGLIDHTVWVYLRIENKTDQYQNNVIQLPYALLDHIHVLIYKDKKLIESYLTGDLENFNSRKKQTNDFVISYTLEV